MTRWPRVAQLRTAAQLREHLAGLGVELPFDESVAPDGPLSRPLEIGGVGVGNRFAILPMEGWDATAEGGPSELTFRRWQRFGESGAKLIWGGEAVAVRPDGRANPHQLLIDEARLPGLARLRESLVQAHADRFGRSDDLLVGLQLTHAGRFARPQPLIAYHHPLLDRRLGIPDDLPAVGDDALAQLAEDFVAASVRAARAGFRFVDLKHCHGYLGHELLSAFERPGPYGGSFENRTRFLCEIVAGVRAQAPDLAIGVRFSAFDFVPFRPGRDSVGTPETSKGEGYRHAFGGDGTGLGIDLSEPCRLLDLLLSLDVRLVCVSAGSPYYNPHIQRPALFPPSDGYQPPEDPLVGVARQIAVTGSLKLHRPELAIVGSAYSYLQEWLPNVAQAVVRTGQADCVGIGRAALSYPDMVVDVLAGRALDRKRICRTFSDCTSAPRRGWVSGCYPLDPLFKGRPEAALLAARRKGIASDGRT
jgi:2,4-dienoyl-CoA reductase-like NADH-dependent reductase (Old Yellow Enzyme family)